MSAIRNIDCRYARGYYSGEQYISYTMNQTDTNSDFAGHLLWKYEGRQKIYKTFDYEQEKSRTENHVFQNPGHSSQCVFAEELEFSYAENLEDKFNEADMRNLMRSRFDYMGYDVSYTFPLRKHGRFHYTIVLQPVFIEPIILIYHARKLWNSFADTLPFAESVVLSIKYNEDG
jgi:hypothetical protein